MAVWLAVCQAPAQAASIESLSLERNAEGLLMSSVVNIDLGPAVEDALLRSVPVYFVAHADVLRERWYWSARRVASVSRTYRLAYQPLTRRWRLSVSMGAGPGSGLQYALHQNQDSLAQALAVIGRLSDWPLADAGQLEPDASYRVDFRFKLDLALLPRPFQLEMNARSDWNLELTRRIEVPATPGVVVVVGEGSPPERLPEASPPVSANPTGKSQ